MMKIADEKKRQIKWAKLKIVAIIFNNNDNNNNNNSKNKNNNKNNKRRYANTFSSAIWMIFIII